MSSSDVLFLSKEDRLLLNLEALRDDYTKRTFKRNKLGLVYVLCPRGLYSLREYLSRKAGMYSAQKKVDDFNMEKLLVKQQEEWLEIDMRKKQKEDFDKLLLDSLYYYGYCVENYNYENSVELYEEVVYDIYNGEFDRKAFVEGIKSAGEDNESAIKAFLTAAVRSERGEACDAVEIYQDTLRDVADDCKLLEDISVKFERILSDCGYNYQKNVADKVDEINGNVNDIDENILTQSTVEQTENFLDAEASAVSNREQELAKMKLEEQFNSSRNMGMVFMKEAELNAVRLDGLVSTIEHLKKKIEAEDVRVAAMMYSQQKEQVKYKTFDEEVFDYDM